MIKSITFKNPKGVKLPSSVYASYELKLDSLKGKTFEFKPGLNVIVGRNGSGKTALLNVIRHLTFCDELFSSSIADKREYWELHTQNSYDKGFWHLVDLRADYRLCTFNLRKSSDFHSSDFASSTDNFLQTMNGFKRSEGENVLDSLVMMAAYSNHGDKWTQRHRKGYKKPKKDEYGHLPHHYFDRQVLCYIKVKAAKEKGGYWGTMWNHLLDYYSKNDDKTLENGLTYLMDEPDKGMDIYNVNMLYNWIGKGEGNIQDIVVLHNIGLIHRIFNERKANFIELSEGYLDDVENFFRVVSAK